MIRYSPPKSNIILGIESSCDDTSVAFVGFDKKILAHKVRNQNIEHSPYKGVVPEIAARSHIKFLSILLKEIILESGIELNQITAVAATGGPGLIGGIIVGTMFGKGLSASLNKPFIAVNHLEGHALTVRLIETIEFPYLLLLISGGHCQFLNVLGVGKYKLLGQTLDDSVGESFDKVAKMLGLDYPGGPIIEKLALKGNPIYRLPLPLIKDTKNCNLSFSGLKTAVKNLIDSLSPLTDQKIYDICSSFQKTVCNILSKKSLIAISQFKKQIPKKTIPNVFVLAGGVAANLALRKKFEKLTQDNDFILKVPPVSLCTDNAAMIAWAGIEMYNQGLISDLNFEPRFSWPLDSDI